MRTVSSPAAEECMGNTINHSRQSTVISTDGCFSTGRSGGPAMAGGITDPIDPDGEERTADAN
jgi:hypothetical protein